MNLEKIIKDKLSNHEFEYSEKAWDKMEKLLDKKAGNFSPVNIFSGASVKYLIIGLSSVAIIGTSIWFLNNKETDTDYNTPQTNNSVEVSEKSNEDLRGEKTSIEMQDLKSDNSTFNRNIETVLNADRISYSKLQVQKKLQLDIDDLLLNDLIKTDEPLIEDEELPIIVKFENNYKDYYFIPNPNIKVYDLPEGHNKSKFEGQHSEVKDKKPMQKPNKKVFNKKRKTFREILGF